MLAKLKEYIVICVHARTALTGSNLAILQQRIVASRPHYWEETEPGIFLIYFAVRRGGRTKSLKLTASLGTLRKPETPYADIGIGRAVGELITEANWYGKILTAPFGDAMNKAMKRAREEAEGPKPSAHNEDEDQ